jgi:hypothetical protein
MRGLPVMFFSFVGIVLGTLIGFGVGASLEAKAEKDAVARKDQEVQQLKAQVAELKKKSQD